MRLRRPLVVALLLAAAPGPEDALAAGRLTIYAASSMQNVLRDVGRAFATRHQGVEIEFSFAGTSTLRAQVEHGAPADVFIGADTLHVGALHRDGICGPPERFATTGLALVTRRGWIVPPAALDVAQRLLGGTVGSPHGGDAPAGAAGTVPAGDDLDRARAVLNSLTRPGTHIVLAGDTVPAGRYAARALERMAADPMLGAAFRKAFEANVASRETSVRAVLAKVVLGEADAGIVYVTDARSATAPVGVVALPPEYDVRADYAAAVLPRSGQLKLAETFVEFLGGAYARSILRRHGFGW